MAETMLITPARLDDDAAIARLQVDSYRSAYAGIFPRDYLDQFSYDDQENDWHQRLNPGTSDVVLVAEAGVFASLRTSPDEVVLVIINLTDRQVTDARLSLASSDLAEGRYVMRSLMVPVLYNELEVDAAGRFEGYSLGPDLPPYGIVLVELQPK